jgi:uncharacterized protein (TIGR00297 family)
LTQIPVVAWTALGISGVFGLVVWKLRAGTAGAAATGSAICASLMFATVRFPYESSWLHGGLLPLLAVFLLAFAATRVGRAKKERLGTAESKRGRNAAQVAANLGIAALVVQYQWIEVFGGVSDTILLQFIFYSAAFAALAEAAADTVSSEIGQVYGGQPRLITSLRKTEPGIDGGVTVVGTLAGILAAITVAAIGTWAVEGSLGVDGGWLMFGAVTAGGIFGLLFDSLLGATLERKGYLNNDAVNFLSTLSASLCGSVVMAGLLFEVFRTYGHVSLW